MQNTNHQMISGIKKKWGRKGNEKCWKGMFNINSVAKERFTYEMILEHRCETGHGVHLIDTWR